MEGKQFLVRMPEEMYEQIKEASVDLDLSMAQIVRRSIKEYLDGTNRELLNELKKKISDRFNVNIMEGDFVLRDGEISHFYFAQRDIQRRK